MRRDSTHPEGVRFWCRFGLQPNRMLDLCISLEERAGRADAPLPYASSDPSAGYPLRMSRAWLVLALTCAACGPDRATKPAGTTNDPVEVCERVADVCRIDKAKLGVCTQRRSAARGAGDAPALGSGFTCASQH